MKNKITLLQLDDILPMVEYGIWLRINGEANYISNNDVWNLILNKYGAWIVCDLHAEGPLNDGGDPHILVAITEDGKKEKTEKKPEEHKLNKDDLVMPNANNYRWFSWETTTEEKKWNFRHFNDTREFFEKTGFETGDVIYVRNKDSNVEYHLMLVGWTKDEILLGTLKLNFKELFRWFELWDGENKFIPFGVEES